MLVGNIKLNRTANHKGMPGVHCHLNILGHAQIVPLLAGVLTPDVGGHGAEKAHEQLHANDESNLEVQEAII